MDVEGRNQRTPNGMTRGVAAAAKPEVNTPFFGLIVPGQPVITNFRKVAKSKFSAQLHNPISIDNICFFFRPGIKIPPLGVVVYFSIDSKQWHLLGSISSDKPSEIFKTGWSTFPAMAPCKSVMLGISVESIDTVKNLQRGVRRDSRELAMHVAKNLHSFMTSFAKPVPPALGISNAIIVPTDIVDRWMTKFKSKYDKDPTFFIPKSR